MMLKEQLHVSGVGIHVAVHALSLRLLGIVVTISHEGVTNDSIVL